MVYRFEIKTDDVVTIQYYIIEDHKYCLIHITDFLDEQIPDADAAALVIVNSFEWV